jgi:hypothetical protein
MNFSRLFLIPVLVLVAAAPATTRGEYAHIDSIHHAIYPEVTDSPPDLPSPFKTADNREFVIAFTKDSKFAIVPVTLGNDRGICQQLIVDSADFPALAETGLHSGPELDNIRSIIGSNVEFARGYADITIHNIRTAPIDTAYIATH